METEIIEIQRATSRIQINIEMFNKPSLRLVLYQILLEKKGFVNCCNAKHFQKGMRSHRE